MITQVSRSATVRLDVNGAGQVSLGPPQGARWRLNLVNVSNTGTVNLASCTIYRGSSSGPLEQVDFLPFSNSGSTGKVAATPFFSGQILWAVWAGGDANATATVQTYGEQRTRSDPPFDITQVGEGFPQIPQNLFIGTPGGGAVVIGNAVPAPIRAFYLANYASTVNAAWIGQYTDANNYRYSVTMSGGIVGQPLEASGWVIAGTVHEISITFWDGTNVNQIWGEITNAHVTFNHVKFLMGDGTSYADYFFDTVALPRGKTASASSTANSAAIGTTQTAVLTTGMTTWRNGRAWRASFGQAISATVAGGEASMQLKVTDAAGALLLGYENMAVPLTTRNQAFNSHGYFCNRSGADVSSQVALCLMAFATPGGTITQIGNATIPRWLAIEDVGAESSYPWALSF